MNLGHLLNDQYTSVILPLIARQFFGDNTHSIACFFKWTTLSLILFSILDQFRFCKSHPLLLSHTMMMWKVLWKETARLLCFLMCCDLISFGVSKRNPDVIPNLLPYTFSTVSWYQYRSFYVLYCTIDSTRFARGFYGIVIPIPCNVILC